MIAHTMIVAISVMFLTSLLKSTHHMNGVVHTVVSFLDTGTASHGGFPAPVGIFAPFLCPLDTPLAPNGVFPSPSLKIFLIFLRENENACTVLALKVFFHLRQLLFIIYPQRGNPLLNTK